MSSYEEGQVWAYRTRRGEERSLVKIQRVEADPEMSEPIFHVSLVGLKWPGTHVLAHAPVSKATLDMSVTFLCPDPGEFPSPEEGIVAWKRARGGVYSVSLAAIAEMGDFSSIG